MELRKLNSYDISEISRWPISINDLLYWANLKNDDVRNINRKLQEWIEADYVTAYVVVHNEKTVGYGEIWTDDGEVEIARLLVRPDHRSQGIGRFLLKLLVNKAKSIDENIWLRVHPNNTLAIDLYKSNGFSRIESDLEAEFNKNSAINFFWMKYSTDGAAGNK